MKSTSLIALATALALCTPAVVYAQTVSVDAGTAANAAVDAAADAAADAAGSSTDANADAAADASVNAAASIDADLNDDGNITIEEQTSFDATVTANAAANAALDTDGDGIVSEGEAAAGGTVAANAGGNVSLDTDGDGKVSVEEFAAANVTVEGCDAGLDSVVTSSTSLDPKSIESATTADIVLVSECDEAEVTAALASGGSTSVRGAIDANAALSADLQSRGVTSAEIIGAAMAGATLTVYATDDTNN